MLVDPFYCVSAALNPSFKLKWCVTEDEKASVKTMIREEINKLDDACIGVHVNENQVSAREDENEPPSKKASYLVLWMTTKVLLPEKR